MSPKSIQPIIVSQALDPAAEAPRTGIAHATITRGTMCLVLPGHGGSRTFDYVLPKGAFALRKQDSNSSAQWAGLIAWLTENTDAEPVLIVDHDHPLREFVILAHKRSGLRYGLRHDKPFSAVREIEYALIGNAAVHLFVSPKFEDDFRKKYIGPYRGVQAAEDLSAALAKGPANSPPPPAASTEGTINLLIVSYFSGPCRSVGVQRPTYWFEEIGRLSGGVIRPHLATAISWGEPHEGIHVVPDHHAAILPDVNGSLPDWAKSFIATDQRNSKAFNTLSHYWRITLEQYFDMREDHFDVVVISGNPFCCFDFAAYAKRRWYARVILDYRDPFANNPRFLYRDDQREHARYIERGYNFQSDAAATVNDMCVELLEARNDIEPIVIPNGFDERVAQKVEPTALTPGVINFVHAGSFYYYGSPRPLLSALDPTKHQLHHIGADNGIDADLLDHPLLIKHGRQPYPNTLSIVGGATCGLVYLTEFNFETTTKVFDYIAMGLDILILTPGELGVGALVSILHGRDGVYWCRNDQESIAQFLTSYTPSPRSGRKQGVEKYSRSHSTSLLIEKIRSLVA